MDGLSGSHPFVVAVPSLWPGGMRSSSSEKFTLCDCFTLVSILKKKIQFAVVLPNPTVRQTGCARRLDILKSFRTDAILVHHLGMRALARCQCMGISAFRCGSGTVQSLVERFLKGTLEPVPLSGECGRITPENAPEGCPMLYEPLEASCTCPYGMCGKDQEEGRICRTPRA